MRKANYHTHTVFCDGSHKAEDVVKEAMDLGMCHLGFSGHMDPDIHMDIDAYYEEIYRLQSSYQDQIEILCGIELDNDYDPACASRAEYIIGSTHFMNLPSEIPLSVDYSPEMMEQICREYFGGDFYRLTKAYFMHEAEILDRFRPTFLGHFDLVTRFNDQMQWFDENDPRYYQPALEVMEYFVSKGLPFEINCGAINRNRKKEPYPNHFLLKHLKAFGGEILINSDAHQKELLLGGFDQAVQAARAAGFDHVLMLTKNRQGQVIFEEDGLSYES